MILCHVWCSMSTTSRQIPANSKTDLKAVTQDRLAARDRQIDHAEPASVEFTRAAKVTILSPRALPRCTSDSATVRNG